MARKWSTFRLRALKANDFDVREWPGPIIVGIIAMPEMRDPLAVPGHEGPGLTGSHCPSGQPTADGATVLGVIGGTVTEPRVGYVAGHLPVTPELLALADPVSPTEVFRFAAPCVEHGCQHFDGHDCRLAERIVQLLPPVVERLPSCRIRPTCRWWQQEGREACRRCPQVVTEDHRPTPAMRTAADPSG